MKKRYQIVLLIMFLVVLNIFSINKNKDSSLPLNTTPNKPQESIIFNQVDANPNIKYFDENGVLIKEYKKEEIEEMKVSYNLYKPNDKMSVYRDLNGVIVNPDENIKKEIVELSDSYQHELFVYKFAEFSNKINMDSSNRQFTKPKSIIIDPVKPFESMYIKGYYPHGKEVFNIELTDISEALNIPLDIINAESYSLEFHTNQHSNETIHLKGGVLIYGEL